MRRVVRLRVLSSETEIREKVAPEVYQQVAVMDSCLWRCRWKVTLKLFFEMLQMEFPGEAMHPGRVAPLLMFTAPSSTNHVARLVTLTYM